MRIAGREVGRGSSPFVIAEIGVNHDGSVERAVELVRAAAAAGADAAKFQLFRADDLMSRASKLAAYQASAGERDPIEMLRRLELSTDQLRPAVEECRRAGIAAIVTVFSVGLVREAEALGVDAYKSASPDIVHKPLLEAMASTGRPLIVSTGASTIDEVTHALGWLRRSSGSLALLQCVSSYPTPEGMEELAGVRALSRVFEGPVGYSDHTPGIETGARAVLAGATILEKHLTHDRGAAGPDHSASLDPAGFAAYVRLAREVVTSGRLAREEKLRAIRGEPRVPLSSMKRVLPIEADVRTLSRQSLTTVRDLPAGHVIRREDLTIKRPGTGLEPWRLESVIGRRLAGDVAGDMPLCEKDLIGLPTTAAA